MLQAGRFGSVGHATDKTVAVATVKLEEQVFCDTHLSVPLSAIKVKFKLPPHLKLPSAGMDALLSVGLHPPLTVNPATQEL